MRFGWLAIGFSALTIACGSGGNEKTMVKNVNDTGMHKQFRMPEWAHTTNIYEVNVRQYTPEGTFNAFSEHLPRLKDMGVETLWFMPVTPIAKKNMKGSLGSYYACSDYTSINPEFGNLDDFKNLVKKAHAMGFKVIIDWVANHTGWDHVWTKEHPDYYHIDSATKDFKVASGMDDIIELDFTNPALRKAMIGAMTFWVTECDIDGFRADLAFWVELPFWKEARLELDAVKPLFWLGEFDELENPEYGEAFDASYTWTWMHKAKDFYQEGLPLDSLYTVLDRYDGLSNPCMRAWFTTNHDENSWNGTEYEKYGDMSAALAVFSATWSGVPLLYSGQELPNKKRIKFFDRDPIAWTGKNQLGGFYKTLLNLHSRHPALRGGDPAVKHALVSTSVPGKVMAYLRKNGDREVLVVLHLSPGKSLRVDITDKKINGSWKDVFSGTAMDFAAAKSLELPAWGYRVFEK